MSEPRSHNRNSPLVTGPPAGEGAVFTGKLAVMAYYGLGLRLDQQPDPRSAGFPLAAVTETDETLLPNYAHWLTRRAVLDQGQTGTCVGHAGEAFLIHPPVVQIKAGKFPTQWDLYRRCCLIDEWPANDSQANLPDGDPGMDFGTSTLALMRVLQSLHLIGTYRWAWDVATISQFIRMQGKNFAGRLGGPVIVGTAWYESMFDPDAEHILRIAPRASVAGGHEWLLVGADQKRALFRMRNSWGKNWGYRGEALVPFEVMDRLLREDGDAVTTNELKLA